MPDRPDEDTEGSPTGAPTVASQTELEAALTTGGRVLVNFYADWCGPCTAVAPVVDALAATTDQRVVKVDVEDHPAIAAAHGVQSIPTFVVYEDGMAVDRLSGVRDETALRAALEGSDSPP